MNLGAVRQPVVIHIGIEGVTTQAERKTVVITGGYRHCVRHMGGNDRLTMIIQPPRRHGAIVKQRQTVPRSSRHRDRIGYLEGTSA